MKAERSEKQAPTNEAENWETIATPIRFIMTSNSLAHVSRSVDRFPNAAAITNRKSEEEALIKFTDETLEKTSAT